MTPEQRRIDEAHLRAVLLRADDALHPARERYFEQWRRETVFPEAVNNWLRSVGRAVR